jgi:hypothetical protein
MQRNHNRLGHETVRDSILPKKQGTFMKKKGKRQQWAEYYEERDILEEIIEDPAELAWTKGFFGISYRRSGKESFRMLPSKWTLSRFVPFESWLR